MEIPADVPLPKIVVFDLDYTLWPCWCDTHISPPVYKGPDTSTVVDRRGQKMAFYDDVPEIIAELKARGVKIAAASRTSAPDLAKSMLKLIHINGQRAIDYFDVLEIYPGTKITHFTFIKNATGIDYKDMLFFDDESRNKEVEHKLGVKFKYVHEGVTWPLLNEAVYEWHQYAGIEY
ncbi:HAD-like domain-containing protein [Lipomyces arxii]|uniref:HAD-like domain-containing protein n=1 Tax=Lipomyces arxii TaxID=56418 RepID=UPI0034CFC98A